MKGFDLFKVYLGVKLHFSSDSYDYFKFRGKTNTSFESYLKRRDKYWFEKLSRSFKDDPTDLFVALFVYNPNQWIGEMMENDWTATYTQWQRKVQNFSHEFGEEMGFISRWLHDNGKGFDALFGSQDGEHPPIVQMLVRGEVSPETFIALDEILRFIPQIDKAMRGDPLWNGLSKRCRKYKPFLRSKGVLSNSIKHRRIVKQKLEEWGVGA
jgi:hypothetical protein